MTTANHNRYMADIRKAEHEAADDAAMNQSTKEKYPSRGLSIVPKTETEKAIKKYLVSICEAETEEQIMELTDGYQPIWAPEEWEEMEAEAKKDSLSLYSQAVRNLERFGIGGN